MVTVRPAAGLAGSAPAVVAVGLALAQVLPEPPNRYHPVAWFGDAMQRVEARRYRDDRRRGIEHVVSGAALAVVRLGCVTRRLVGPGGRRRRWPRRSPSVVGCSPSRRPPSAPRSSAGDLGRGPGSPTQPRRPGPVRSRYGRDRPSGRGVGGGEHRRRAWSRRSCGVPSRAGVGALVVPRRQHHGLPWWAITATAIERYGWAAARLDDLVNWAAARLSRGHRRPAAAPPGQGGLAGRAGRRAGASLAQRGCGRSRLRRGARPAPRGAQPLRRPGRGAGDARHRAPAGGQRTSVPRCACRDRSQGCCIAALGTVAAAPSVVRLRQGPLRVQR